MLRELERALRCRPAEEIRGSVEKAPSLFSVLSARRSSEFPVFHIRNRFNDREDPGNHSLSWVFEGVIKDGGRTTHTFSFPGGTLLSEIVEGLSGASGAFLVLGDRIFLDKGDAPLFSRLVSLAGMENYAFLGMDTKVGALGLSLGSCLSFFNGKKRLKIRVTRCTIVHSFRTKLFLNCLERRALFCTVCEKRSVDFKVTEDPVLPNTRKALCRECFDLLFIDRDGEPRYPGMKYERC